MIRKLFFLSLVLIALVLILCSCGVGDNTEQDPAQETNESTSENVISKGNWYCFDEKTRKKQYLAFGDDGTFSFSCECGDHTGLLTSYDKAYVSLEDRLITFSNAEGDTETVAILYCDSHFLWLKLPHSARLLKNADNDLSMSPHPSAAQYFSDDEYALFSFLSYEDGQLTLAPYNYDRDAHASFASYVCKANVAKDVTLEEVTVTVDHTAGGDPVISHTSLTSDDFEYIGEYYTYGYALLSEDGLITKVTFYGETEIR